MMSIRFRLNVLMALAFTLVIGLGYMAAQAYLQSIELNAALRQSYWLVEQGRDLVTARFDAKRFKDLQEVRSELKPNHRLQAFSNVLQSYSDRHPRLIRERVKFLERSEKEYQNYVRPLIEYLEKRILYYGGICLLTCLMVMCLTYSYVVRSVFGPLKDLARKMVDFLNHKYTYQFSVPAPNEVGNLQATFNALAQRVLSNMEELKSLDRAKSEFLSIASHELRTPLTSIKGSLSLLNSGVVGKFPEPATNLITIAENETDRLIRLINDLLDLAKIEARKFPLQKTWVPLESLVKDTLQSMQGFAQPGKVKLLCSGELAVDVNMDKDRIQQVLTNLMSNAIKYSPEQGSVTVHAEIDDYNHLKISVIDQGKGIAPEDQELIFEKFRQATSPDNPLVKGTGLGLAIAKALVDEHNGTIGVHSKPGQGSSFYFTLPDWRQAEEMEQQEDLTPTRAKAA